MAIWPPHHACLIFRGRNHKLAMPLGRDAMRSTVLVQHAAPLDTQPGAAVKRSVSCVFSRAARLKFGSKIEI